MHYWAKQNYKTFVKSLLKKYEVYQVKVFWRIFPHSWLFGIGNEGLLNFVPVIFHHQRGACSIVVHGVKSVYYAHPVFRVGGQFCSNGLMWLLDDFQQFSHYTVYVLSEPLQWAKLLVCYTLCCVCTKGGRSSPICVYLPHTDTGELICCRGMILEGVGQEVRATSCRLLFFCTDQLLVSMPILVHRQN